MVTRKTGAAIPAHEVFESLNRVFEHLSLAAVIGGQLLAMGPGARPQGGGWGAAAGAGACI